MKRLLLSAIITLAIPIVAVLAIPETVSAYKRQVRYNSCHIVYRQPIKKRSVKKNPVVEFIYDVTVTIETRDTSGAGVIVSPDGFILTAAHIMRKGAIRVRIRDDNRLYYAKLVYYCPKKDLSLLKINPRRKLRYAKLSKKYTEKNGVYISGYPYFRKRIIGGLTDETVYRRINGYNTHINSINASIKPGFSGGGVFDAKTGRLEGIIVAYDKGKTKSYSVCLESCKQIFGLANRSKKQ